MTGAIPALIHRVRPLLAAICLGATSVLMAPQPAAARGPDGIADVAEKVIDAVVNISTSQTVEAKGGGGDLSKCHRPPHLGAGLGAGSGRHRRRRGEGD